MIVIDGQQCDINVKNFENLEQVFAKVVEDGYLNDRVVTDVFVNDEPFSEIYPHQAEDVETGEVERLVITSVPIRDMAVSMTGELSKVIRLMAVGGRRVAELFRNADDAEALEMYQDLLDVTKDFIGMVGTLRSEFGLSENPEFIDAAEGLSSLFGEMTDVLENEDWILLADLLEYEFMPAVEKWERVIESIGQGIRNAVEA